MDVLINEFSFSGQAQSFQHATELMRKFKEVLETISPMLGKGRRYVCKAVLPAQMLYPGLTVKEWIGRSANINKDLRTFYSLVIANSSDITTLLSEVVPTHFCIFNEKCVNFSSIAGGAHLKGVLACLDQSPEFSTNSIQVEFSSDGGMSNLKTIEIVFAIEHIWGHYRPHYIPSPKHLRGGWGTLMDLDDQVAQGVLDQGIVSGKQIYGYHDGKYYEFKNDNAGGFHGYPIGEAKLPVSVKKELYDRGIIR